MGCRIDTEAERKPIPLEITFAASNLNPVPQERYRKTRKTVWKERRALFYGVASTDPPLFPRESTTRAGNFYLAW